MKITKTYEGMTLAEIKKMHNGAKAVYCRYQGLGDHGIAIEGVFYTDDMSFMNRHHKAAAKAFTGLVANLDFSCEVFVNGCSMGTTSKWRGQKYLSMIKKGVEVDSSYLSSTRPIGDFLSTATEAAKTKTAINEFVHSLIDGGGKAGHDARNQIRAYAYAKGLEAAKERYL